MTTETWLDNKSVLNVWLDDVLDYPHWEKPIPLEEVIQVKDYRTFCLLVDDAVRKGIPLGDFDLDHFLTGNTTGQDCFLHLKDRIRVELYAKSTPMRFDTSFYVRSHSGCSEKQQELYLMWRAFLHELKTVHLDKVMKLGFTPIT